MRKLFFLIGTLITLVVSCDTYEKDVEPKYNVINVTTGSNATIRAKSFLGEAASYEVSQAPQNGFTSFFQGDDSEYLSYSSLTDFSSNDSFTIRAKDASGGIIETQNFLIKKALSCGLGPVTDTVRVQVGQTVVIDLLLNDHFCGVDFKDAAIFTGGSIGPEGAGEATYAIDKNAKKVTLTFQAGTTPGLYLVTTYNLGLNQDFDLLNTTLDWRDHPERFERFLTALVNFDVIE